MCALCQLKDEFQAHPAAQMIDVYSYFADRFYGVKDPRPIIPHDREMQHMPPEDEATEPEAEAPIEPQLEPSIGKEQEAITSADQEPQLLEKEEHSEVSETTEVRAEGALPEKPLETTMSPEQPETTSKEEQPMEEDNEPFADILGHKEEDKDKKRYSPNPIQQQQSEQTTQTSD